MAREAKLIGSLWFPRQCSAEVLAMIRTGALDLSPLVVREFPLHDVNTAIGAAREKTSELGHCVVKC